MEKNIKINFSISSGDKELDRFYFDGTSIDNKWAIRDRLNDDDPIWIDCPKDYLSIIIEALNKEYHEPKTD